MVLGTSCITNGRAIFSEALAEGPSSPSFSGPSRNFGPSVRRCLSSRRGRNWEPATAELVVVIVRA